MSDGQNKIIVNDTDDLARQFHERYEEVAPLYGYTTRNDTRVFDPESPNGRLMRAVCLQVVGPIIAERNSLQDQRDFCMGEIERLRKERDEAREALRVLFKDYKELADSGDAGFWDLEDQEAAQPALRILQQMDYTK